MAEIRSRTYKHRGPKFVSPGTKKLWLATCQLLSELRTRVTDDLVSVAAVVPLQVFGCVILVHVAIPVNSTILDGHTLRLSVETSL